MKRHLEIVDSETGSVVHRVDVSTKTDRQIEKIERGILMRTAEPYFVRDTNEAKHHG